jgi:RNA polymerase sigma-70 factor, ECF subfamily
MVKRKISMLNDSDMELVNLAINGDERSYSQLIEKYYHFVYSLSFKWCRIKEDAEEITQEVFMKLSRKLNTFNHDSSFRTWLYRITINTAKDYSRKNCTKQTYESAFAQEQSSENAGSSSSELLEANRVYDALDKLPAKQKAAMMLVFAEGLSHKEAATILNCSETTVSWRIHQARKRLNKIFTGWCRDGK